jgi:hypothetical protein
MLADEMIDEARGRRLLHLLTAPFGPRGPTDGK